MTSLRVVASLLVQPWTGRMVGSVYLGMAADAAATHQAFVRRHAIGQRAANLQVVGMAYVRVALLAQERDRRDQQRMLVGTMRRVAVEAAVAHRSVFEQHTTEGRRVGKERVK